LANALTLSPLSSYLPQAMSMPGGCAVPEL
jgi:hypothetical protein